MPRSTKELLARYKFLTEENARVIAEIEAKDEAEARKPKPAKN